MTIDLTRINDDTISIDGAPKLPLPKPHGWGSLVHLHGRITAVRLEALPDPSLPKSGPGW